MDKLGFFYCALLAALKNDPPGFTFQGQYFHAFPINRETCRNIDRPGDVTFDLYTRKNIFQPSPLEVNNDELLKTSGLDFNASTIIFYHGFLESSQSPDAIGIKNAYLQRSENYNVILVNAKLLLAGPWYLTSMANCVYIGKTTALLIDYLVSRSLPLSKVVLIGHSLGAHSAGNTGSNIKSGRISQLIALDPAGPLYEKVSDSRKLDITDAIFLSVIHTDMGKFGSSQSTGHVTFFPNGGRAVQPGCSAVEILKTDPTDVSELIFCSHRRSYKFYTESVTNEHAFVAYKCKSWSAYVKADYEHNDVAKMGFSTTNSTRGNYCLYTNDKPPYSKS